MKRNLLIVGSVCAALVVLCGVFVLIGYGRFMALDAVEYDADLEILLGGGGNSVVLTSEDGSAALVVDTKTGIAAKRMRKKVRAKTVTVVNTHCHGDHAGGNALYPDARLMAGAYPKELWSVMTRGGRYPDAALGPGEEIVIKVGSETARVRNMGRAHTSNDVAVYLEKRKVLITGDMVFHGAHPVLFAQSGCSTASWTALLDSLGRYEITALVPGHGQVSDRSALIAMKEYFTSIRSAVDDPERLAALREKYKKLHAVPGMSGFARTVGFIREENLRSQP